MGGFCQVPPASFYYLILTSAYFDFATPWILFLSLHLFDPNNSNFSLLQHLWSVVLISFLRIGLKSETAEVWFCGEKKCPHAFYLPLWNELTCTINMKSLLPHFLFSLSTNRNAFRFLLLLFICAERGISSFYFCFVLLQQTVSDIERGWILVSKDQHRQLKSLQEKGSKKEVSKATFSRWFCH